MPPLAQIFNLVLLQDLQHRFAIAVSPRAGDVGEASSFYFASRLHRLVCSLPGKDRHITSPGNGTHLRYMWSSSVWVLPSQRWETAFHLCVAVASNENRRAPGCPTSRGATWLRLPTTRRELTATSHRLTVRHQNTNRHLSISSTHSSETILKGKGKYPSPVSGKT